MGGDAGTVTTVRVPVMDEVLELPKYYDMVFLGEESNCPYCRGPVTKKPGLVRRELRHLFGRVTRLTFRHYLCARCLDLVPPAGVAAAVYSANCIYHADVVRLCWRLQELGRSVEAVSRELADKYGLDIPARTILRWSQISGPKKEIILTYKLAS